MYKKYIDGIARTFPGFAPNNNGKSISKFGRIYPAAQKVVSTGVPTRFRRAGILAKAQKLETEKTTASLIRID